jgi:Tfp pilus assembly protein PilN
MTPIDFLPKRIRAQQALRERRVRQVYLVIVSIAMLVLVASFRQERLGSARGEVSQLIRRKSKYEYRLGMRTSLEQQLAELRVKKEINSTLGTRVDALDLLAEIGRVVPECVVLTDLDFETTEIRAPLERNGGMRGSVQAGGGKLNDQAHKRIRLTMTGLAPKDVDVAEFIGRMSSSPLFEDVNMGYAKNVPFRGRNAREFKASCYVVK